MHVYFVRHGETFLNRSNVHQSPNTPLSPRGQEGAISIAEYLRGVNPDVLLTSSYTRALETARIIGNAIGKKPEIYDDLHEMIRPSSFYGTSQRSFETFWYVFRSLRQRHNPTWRYNDGETFYEVSERARRVLRRIESHAQEYGSIVIVSHNIFINLMVAYMCHETLTIPTLLKAYFHLHVLKNSSVLHMQYDPHNHTCAWQVIGYHVPKA
jgi:broad specificity phosphatase PhoE